METPPDAPPLATELPPDPVPAPAEAPPVVAKPPVVPPVFETPPLLGLVPPVLEARPPVLLVLGPSSLGLEHAAHKLKQDQSKALHTRFDTTLMETRTFRALSLQGPAPGPLLQYSLKRLPVALYARPLVAAAAQGAVLLIWPAMVDSRMTAWPFGVGVVLLASHDRPR